MGQCATEHISPTLTQRVAMETFYVGRQLFGQQRIPHPETGARSTRIVKQSLHFRIFGIDADATANAGIDSPHPLVVTLILSEGIESEVARTPSYLVDLIIRICRRKRVGLAPKLLIAQPGLPQRTRRGGLYVLLEDRKSLPQGIGLKSQYNFHIGRFSHTADE